MPTNQQAQPLRLEPNGLYVTPAAVSLLGVTDAGASSLALFRLLLHGEAELHIPVTAEAVEAIRVALQRYPEVPDIPQIGD